MKKLLPFITVTCLTAFSATTVFPVMAGGCSSRSKKTSEVKCEKNDTECQSKNTEKFDLNQAIKS